MIDIHSHIMPSVDDGCRDLNECLEVIKKASKVGVKKIFATPHFKEPKHSVYKKDIDLFVNDINKLLISENIDVEILCGSEIKIISNLIDLVKDGSLSTLNNSKYILIELDLHVKTINIVNIIKDIVLQGYAPIIAHPERYDYIVKDYREAIAYVEAGALLQLDIGSLNGRYDLRDKKTSLKLLKHNLIHLWGSDSHGLNCVYDNFELVLKVLKKTVKEDIYNDIVFNNPNKVYMNEDIKIFDIKKSKFFR